MNHLVRLALASLLLLAPPAPPSVGEASAQEILPPGPVSELVVETATGVYPFMVELADEPRERAQGLMYRREMARDQGMLFDMGVTRPAGFWMQDTYISLDIIFIGEDGLVKSMAERTEPLSEAVLESGEPVRFVLELVAGMARQIGLKRGDRVRHPSIEAVAGR
ncbi:MAG TPA: DUF192 domain-containing protein [Methylomirabilota bacterium]|nr:DUF192 domain-containing protein [Methylomirabilota bacterium]